VTAEDISAALDSIAGDFGRCAPPIPPEKISAVLISWDRLPALVRELFIEEVESPPLEQMMMAFFTGFYFGFLASQKAEEAKILNRTFGVVS
jgi:hypothetical protein